MALPLVLGLLGGCSAGSQAIIDEALARSESGIQAAKDREALALKSALCLISVGAKNRVLTQAEKDHVEALCGGAPGLTLQDLTNLATALGRIRADANQPSLPLPLADGLPQ